jgi:YggT family protein
MFILGNFLIAAGKVVDIALTLYMWVIIVRALISWVNPDPYNPIVRFLHSITDPFLFWIRRVLRLPYMAIDISPLIAILLILFLKYFIVKSLFMVGYRMGGRAF